MILSRLINLNFCLTTFKLIMKLAGKCDGHHCLPPRDVAGETRRRNERAREGRKEISSRQPNRHLSSLLISPVWLSLRKSDTKVGIIHLKPSVAIQIIGDAYLLFSCSGAFFIRSLRLAYRLFISVACPSLWKNNKAQFIPSQLSPFDHFCGAFFLFLHGECADPGAASTDRRQLRWIR